LFAEQQEQVKVVLGIEAAVVQDLEDLVADRVEVAEGMGIPVAEQGLVEIEGVLVAVEAVAALVVAATAAVAEDEAVVVGVGEAVPATWATWVIFRLWLAHLET
jgi:hypothetical protein